MPHPRVPDGYADGNAPFSSDDPRTRQGTAATAAKRASQLRRSPGKKMIRAPVTNSNPLFHPMPGIHGRASAAIGNRRAAAGRCARAQICRSYTWADIRELLRWPLQKFADSATPCESASRLSRFALPSDMLDPPQSSGGPIVLPPQRVCFCFHRTAKPNTLIPDHALSVRLVSAPRIAVALCASIAESHQRAAPEWHLTERSRRRSHPDNRERNAPTQPNTQVPAAMRPARRLPCATRYGTAFASSVARPQILTCRLSTDRSLRCKFRVYLFQSVHRLVPSQPAGCGSSAFGQTHAQFQVAQYLFDGLCHCCGFMHNHQRGYSIEQRSHSAIFRDYHRRTAGRGFRRCVAKIFILRRQHEHIGIAIRHPFHLAEYRAAENHARIHFLCSRQLLQANLHSRFVGAGERQPHLFPVNSFADLCKTLQQQIRTFFRGQPSQKQNQQRLCRNAMFTAKSSALRQLSRCHNSVPSQHDFRTRNSPRGQLLHFLLRRRNQPCCPSQHFFAPLCMVHALQKNISHDGHKHSDRLDEIWNFLFPALAGDCETQ